MGCCAAGRAPTAAASTQGQPRVVSGRALSEGCGEAPMPNMDPQHTHMCTPTQSPLMLRTLMLPSHPSQSIEVFVRANQTCQHTAIVVEFF